MRSLHVATIALALLVVGPLLARFGAVKPLQGFLIFLASGVVALVALAMGVWLGLKGQRQGWVGLALALIPLALIGKGFVVGGKLPRINDISTDLEDPPSFVAAGKADDNHGKDLGYPPDFVAIVRSGYPDLAPLELNVAADSAFDKVALAISAQPGWTITHKDAAAGVIEAEVTGGIFRFVDDIVIRVRSAPSGARVDARSRSRVGKGDFGANAARIQALFAALR